MIIFEGRLKLENILAKVEHLKMSYGSVNAVKDVSFKLYEGEILAIIGPNGAGKTSTVECIEGLRKPDAGLVEVFGEIPYTNRNKLYQRIGIQLQEVSYPDKIKVKELCKLFSSFYENPVDWKQLLSQLGLMEKSNRYVKKLSGGEKQRLSILLALLPRPKLMILDELTTGLDPEVRRGLWESLRQIKKSGTTILLVSHYLDEVEHLADRIVYLEEGFTHFVGTKEGFKAYVADRVGDNEEYSTLSLEEAYIKLSPKTNIIKLEDII